MAVAEPVFCSTHHASAIVYRLSPTREITCPLHSKAKERSENARNIVITGVFSFHNTGEGAYQTSQKQKTVGSRYTRLTVSQQGQNKTKAVGDAFLSPTAYFFSSLCLKLRYSLSILEPEKGHNKAVGQYQLSIVPTAMRAETVFLHQCYTDHTMHL